MKLVLIGTLKCSEYSCEEQVQVPVALAMSAKRESFTITIEPEETPEGWEHTTGWEYEEDEYYCPKHLRKKP